MQKVTRFLIFTFLFSIVVSFVPAKDNVQWLTVAQLKEVYAKEPRPILVDVYTDWCGWCKVMDKETYRNKKVAAYINQHYYAVKLNAETKDSVEWNGKIYGYSKLNKVNELAVFLTYGQLSFPTTVFLTAIDAQSAPLSGYLKAKEIEVPLKFFGEGIYKTTTFPTYNQHFISSW